MKIGYLKYFKNWNLLSNSCLLAILINVFCLQQPCRAQSALDASSFDDLSKQFTWVSGPQKITVGDYADIQVPQGYRWANADDAKALLQSANNPVPNDLIGLIASDSTKWWAILEFNPNGYVKGADTAQIDAKTVLKEIQTVGNDQRAQEGAAQISSLNWQTQPVYDQNSHSLTWSVQIETPSMKAVNQSVALLGRGGVLLITAVQPNPAPDTTSLNQIAGNIAFKPGQRYTDYQNGDKIAQVDLVDLIVGGNRADMARTGGATAVWAYSVIGVCIIAGGVLLLRNKNSRQAPVREAASAKTSTSHAPAIVIKDTYQNGAVLTNGAAAANGVAPINIAAPVNGSAGVKNGSKHLHRGRRKKVFNYPKFYTHVMRELSLHSYGPGTAMNGKSHSLNGHHNGHANGHTNGHTNGNNANGANGSNGKNGSGVNESIKAEIEELIATQKNLIQEQKCLLEQQTKLIEEKRWLIEEQAAFLKGQAEQQFPLKFE